MLQDVMFLKEFTFSSGTALNSQVCLVSLFLAGAEQTLLCITVFFSPPLSSINYFL